MTADPMPNCRMSRCSRKPTLQKASVIRPVLRQERRHRCRDGKAAKVIEAEYTTTINIHARWSR